MIPVVVVVVNSCVSLFPHRCHLFWKYGDCHDGANVADLDDGDHVCREVAARYQTLSPYPTVFTLSCYRRSLLHPR